MRDKSRLSVSNWRKIIERLAPSAARMTISFRRPRARASNRLATLAQAISNTSITAADSMPSLPRMSPATRSRRLVAGIAMSPFESGALGFCLR
jgi:hypothetical protein